MNKDELYRKLQACQISLAESKSLWRLWNLAAPELQEVHLAIMRAATRRQPDYPLICAYLKVTGVLND